MASLLEIQYDYRNFTDCSVDSLVNVTRVDRFYDSLSHTYHLFVEGQVLGPDYPPAPSSVD